MTKRREDGRAASVVLAAFVFAALSVFLSSRLPAQQPYFQQSIRYTIGASLDEPTGTLSGIAQLVYRNNSRDTLHDIYFHQYLNAFRPGSLWSADEQREGIDRFANLPEPYNAFERFEDVRIDGAPAVPDYPHAPDSTIAHFALPHALRPGDSLVVLMRWTARPSVIPRRQGRQGRRFDFAQWYPKVCVYDRYGWEAHPLRLAGELYGEYGTYDVTLDVAEDQVLAASGVPVEGDPGWGAGATLQRNWYPQASGAPRPEWSPVQRGRKRVRFYAENIHHFAWSANPAYRYEEGRYHDVVLRTLYLPEDSATWGGGRVIARTQRAMAWLDSIFGPYPYPQTIVLHRIEGGGTEFPMMVMNGGPEESLIFHEVGHIYTYGILGNNEWKEGFLDEGFTTFQTAWNFQRRGMGVPSTATQQLILNLDLDGWSEPVSKVSETYSEFGIYNRMIYTKGQLFYEMLRYSLGADAFRRGLRLYYDRWKFRHVDENALRAAMEEVSGKDLREFFTEWLHGTPTVDYRLGSVQRWRSSDTTWTTEITVNRLGGGVMPVDIAVPAGDTVYTVRASGEPRREAVSIVTPVRTGRVELDPARQTMDWNYLNNREAAGPFKLLGPVGPPSVNRFGWSGSAPSRRDRRVNNWMPLLWYNDAGGLNVGGQLRTNYLGRFDQDAIQLTFAPRNQPGSQLGNLWLTLRNPHWLRAPRVRWGADLYYVEGRRGGRVWGTMDRSPHLTFGPRVTAGFEVSHMNVTSIAYLDPGRWSDLSVTELSAFLADRWNGDHTRTDMRLSGGAGIGGDPASFGLGSPRTYLRGTAELRHLRAVGRFELRTRIFAGGSLTLGQDSLDVPLQRAIYLSGADPYETFANPFLRSRGALFARRDVNYQAAGGSGLRAYRDDLRTNLVGALNAELVLPVFRKPARHAFNALSVAAFGDVAVLGKAHSVLAVSVPATLADAGVGLRAQHRLGPTTFTTRVDFPLFVSVPALAAGANAGDGRTAFRFVWSLEESF